jgi:hypothetical protein
MMPRAYFNESHPRAHRRHGNGPRRGITVRLIGFTDRAGISEPLFRWWRFAVRRLGIKVLKSFFQGCHGVGATSFAARSVMDYIKEPLGVTTGQGRGASPHADLALGEPLGRDAHVIRVGDGVRLGGFPAL